MKERTPSAEARALLARTAEYARPSVRSSVGQILNSFGLFLGLLYLAWLSATSGWWYGTTLLVSALAGLSILRIFIIQHDCGHGSFFASKRANDAVGVICSIFTFIPYFYWRRQHAIHHATTGNLERRGHGDMDVLTVREYEKLSRFEKLRYRIYRHPIGFLVLGPIFFFLVINRFVLDRKTTTPRERWNVYWTNATLAALIYLLGTLFTWPVVAAVGLPMLYTAGAAGIWMFYIQHQFEHTYWQHEGEWEYLGACMQGSSYYKLPRVLQWLTGNIGFHHIHHLKPLIPNYRLEACHKENEVLQGVPTLTLWSSIRTIMLTLWDEDQQRLISFREYERVYGKSSAVGQPAGADDQEGELPEGATPAPLR